MNYYGSDGDSIYIYGGGLSLGGISPYATVGYLDVDGDKTTPAGYDYVYYTVGASYDIGHFTLDLHWFDAEEGADAAVQALAEMGSCLEYLAAGKLS